MAHPRFGEQAPERARAVWPASVRGLFGSQRPRLRLKHLCRRDHSARCFLEPGAVRTERNGSCGEASGEFCQTGMGCTRPGSLTCQALEKYVLRGTGRAGHWGELTDHDLPGFPPQPAALAEHFPGSRSQKTAARVINIFLRKLPELEPGANPVVE